MSWFGELIGSGLGKAVATAATPFTDAWIKNKQSLAATHKIDKETERDILIENVRADVQLGLAQRLLNDADRTHWSTRWMRPAFGALAFIWAAAELWFWIKGGRPPVELDPIVKYLLGGIIASLFLLRPIEKNKRTELAAKAVQQGVPARTLAQRILKRADDQ